MEEQAQESIFDDISGSSPVRRKYLIPKWIRFFAWIFAVICPLSTLAYLLNFILRDDHFTSSIYGLSSANIVSLASVLGLAAFMIKGIAAIGLLTEKDWAVKTAIADSVLGIILCIFSMIVNPWVTHTVQGGYDKANLNLRPELLLLIPYLIIMINIKRDWQENKYAHKVLFANE